MKKEFVAFIMLLLVLSTASCSNDSANASLEAADILLVNGTVVIADSRGSVIENAVVAVRNGEIIACGTADTSTNYEAAETIDVKGKIIMPGLINTHTHAAMTIFRGFADDLVLQDWLENYIWPAEGKYINEETVRLGTLLAIAEMIRSGTTTFADMYFFENTVGEVAREAGIRVLLGESLIDFSTPNAATPEEGLEYTEMLLQKWQNDSLVKVSVALHSPYTCSPELLKSGKELADKYRVPLQIHVSETESEVNDIMTRFGFTPFGYLENLGILGDNIVAAHCVHLTDDDIRLIVERKVGVSHNLQSNLKLASGISPIPDLSYSGAEIGLATDGASSNNDLNMFEEMDLTAKVHKAIRKDATVLDAQTVVEMATIGGAKVLGMDNRIGSVEVGKRADLIIIDTNKPHLTPMFNPYSHIVYAVDGADVETVIIDGKIVMRDYKLLTIDENEIMEQVRELAAQIKADL